MLKKILSLCISCTLLTSVIPSGLYAASAQNNSWHKETSFDEFENGRALDRTYPWNLGGSITGASEYTSLKDSPLPVRTGDKAVCIKSENKSSVNDAFFECNLGEANAFEEDMYVNFKLLLTENSNIDLKIYGFNKKEKKSFSLFALKEGQLYINNNIDEQSEFSFSEWNEVLITVEPKQGTYSIAINGENLMNASDEESFKLPESISSVYKAGIYTTEENSVAYIDDFRFAMVDIPENEEDAENEKLSKTSLDTWENNIEIFESIMKDKLAMVVDSPKYLLNGVPGHYNEQNPNIYPVEKENTMLVPARFLADYYNVGISFDNATKEATFTKNGKQLVMRAGSREIYVDGKEELAADSPEIVNGSMLVPVNEFVSFIGKKVYTDKETGLVIIGNTSKPFNTRKKMDLKSEFAKAVRYERPDPERVINDIKANPRNFSHPRLYITMDDIEILKQRIKTDEFLKQAYSGIKEEAERYSKLQLPKWTADFGKTSTTAWFQWIEAMMLTYWIDGDKKYLDRSIEVVMALTEWPDYGTYSSLAHARCTISLTIGYDWLYNYLSDEQKSILLETITEKSMKYNLEIYKGESVHTGNKMMGGWPTWGNNFTTQSNESVIYTLIATWEENEELVKEMLHYFFRSMETVFEWLRPDGGGKEGIGYLLAGTIQEGTLAFIHLSDATGTDYGYLSSKPFKWATESLIYMDGTEGVFNYGDQEWAENIPNLETQFWLGRNLVPKMYLYRKNYLDNMSDEDEFGFTLMDMLYYDPDFKDDSGEFPLSKHYRGSETVGIRNSWDSENAAFLGFKGGDSVMSHSHRDLGSFILDMNGVRWFGDTGKVHYLYNNKSVLNEEAYGIRAEGHNVLMLRNANDIITVGEPDKDNQLLLKADDFEATPVGSAPAWETSLMGGAVAEIADDNGNHALLMKGGSSGLDEARVLMSFRANQITESFTLEYKIKVNRFDDENYAQFFGIYGREGTIEDNPSGTTKFMQLHPLRPDSLNGVKYEIGEWYSVKAVINLKEYTQDMYVDGELVVSEKAINSSLENMSLNNLMFSTWKRDMECYLDDIKVSVANNEHNSKAVLASKKSSYDQSTAAVSEIISFVNGSGNSYAVADLSEVYPDYSNNYKRGAGLFCDKEILVIRDEAVIKKDCESYWFGHTLADITLSEDGKSAVLTDSESGKRLWVGIMTDGPERFTAMESLPFPESPYHPNEDNVYKDAGKKKLTIKTERKAGDKINLTVMAAPLYGNAQVPYKLPEVLPLSEWKEENATGNQISAILLNGEPLEGFDCRQNYYENVFTQVKGKEAVSYSIPVVSVPDGENAQIRQAEFMGDTAEITVGEGKNARKYLVCFREETIIDKNDLPVYADPYPLTNKIVNAGDYDIAIDSTKRSFGFASANSVFYIENCFDNDFTTPHSVAPMNAFEEIDLGVVGPVSALEIAWFNGLKRQEMFKIYTSLDAVNWECVYPAGVSSGMSTDFERYEFPTVQARYIRIESLGNSAGSYFANMSELRIRK